MTKEEIEKEEAAWEYAKPLSKQGKPLSLLLDAFKAGYQQALTDLRSQKAQAYVMTNVQNNSETISYDLDALESELEEKRDFEDWRIKPVILLEVEDEKEK